MSTVPAEIAGIGSSTIRLRVSPGFDPLKAAVGPDEYFLLSRIDGTQSVRDVLLSVGLPIERGIAIVQRLRSIGALLLPGETTAPPPTSPSSAAGARVASADAPRVASGRLPTSPGASPLNKPARGTNDMQPVIPDLGHDLRLTDPTPGETAALAEDCVVPEDVRRRVLAIQRLLVDSHPHAILGVPATSDPKTIKRAYFVLSKEIHPDRYYGKKVGSFGDRLVAVFEAASRAYAVLTDDKARRHAAGPAQARTPTQDQPQTPQEYAAELFNRACQLEVGGDALGAMKLFAAAVRVDPQIRYLRRAASCAIAADQPRSAVEYAKKAHTAAPNDVSSARLLAAAFREAGKLSDAEEVLLMAMAMKSENDVLTAELRNDLAQVRRQMGVS